MQPDKGKVSVRTLKLGTQVRLSIRLMFALDSLSVMAGVERTPGPPKKTQPPWSASVSSQSRLAVNDDEGLGRASGGSEEAGSGQPMDLNRVLQGIQGELRSLNRNYTEMNTKFDSLFNTMNTKYEQLRSDHEDLKMEFSTLQKRCDYLESQPRRNNLVFYGFDENNNETWDECESKIKTYMSYDLDINPESVMIERAHRLGNGNKPRPIIAKFLNFKDKQKVQNRIKEKIRDEREWENPHRVSEDFTQSVRDQRKGLTPFMRNARAAEKQAYLSFNKLVIDGKMFLLDTTTGGLKAVRKADRAHAGRYTRHFGSADMTRGQAHGNVDNQARDNANGSGDASFTARPLAGSSQSENLGHR
ncbi:MAG: hypothetical protein N0C90_25955 [Candidatus Thiodiazotropha endolucinida]|nr:hypothetical protein [Candidatus Thiodiazotropha taylori]MCW4264794.1 hypothetical protein [Candidatus Thiodiazotropha endolucinida]